MYQITPTRTLTLDYSKQSFTVTKNPHAHTHGIIVPMCYVVILSPDESVNLIFTFAIRLANVHGFPLTEDDDGEEFANLMADKIVDAFPDILTMFDGNIPLDDGVIDLPVPVGYVMPYMPMVLTDDDE
jgi:hypothetical protein